MCGIAGIVELAGRVAPPRESLERMIGTLHHRGPDEAGLYRDEHAGLAHTRLSIVDLRSGQQPLCSADNAHLWIVFNGEIFNYIELRAELAELGHSFVTRSDTEVVVAAWREWGEAAFRRFVGQWALAIWDAQRKELVLSRDRFGICPLHYAEHAGRVVFDSVVAALFAGSPELPRALDPGGLAETFTFWTVAPPQSVFRGVRELEPGHVRRYHDGRVSDRAYWSFTFPPRVERSPHEATEAARAALEEATALRMVRADVPVGSYLSGGLDSSLLAALALRATGARFHTFSLRFEDAEYDETGFQRAMAERLGTEHHEVLVTHQDIARIFPEVVRHTERPILRTAPAPLKLLSQLVRSVGLKVVLTGEGADEIFGGYDIFREGKVRRFWARRPESALRPLLLERLYPYLRRSPVANRAMARRFFGRDLHRSGEPGFAHGPRWATGAGLLRLLAPETRREANEQDVVQRLLRTLPPEVAGWTPLSQDQLIEIRTLLSGYLLSSQGDRMLMSHSVEGRFPFLDHRVVRMANELLDVVKLPALNEKAVLKRVAANLVPREIVRRKKQPYRAPDAAAFVGEDAPEWVADVTSPEAVARAGVFEPELVGRLVGKCRKLAPRGRLSNADDMALVGVLSTQLLHRQMVARGPEVATDRPLGTVVDRCTA